LRLKKNKNKLKEVVCLECNTINTIKLPTLSGTVTFFCKNCGAEIHLVFDRMVLDMELNYPRATDDVHK
jgi:transcription elongation factor Elf1